MTDKDFDLLRPKDYHERTAADAARDTLDTISRTIRFWNTVLKVIFFIGVILGLMVLYAFDKARKRERSPLPESPCSPQSPGLDDGGLPSAQDV